MSKYDGFRALCYLEQWRSHFVSRNGKPLSRFTALADELADVLEVDEAVSVEGRGCELFELMRRTISKASWQNASLTPTARAPSG